MSRVIVELPLDRGFCGRLVAFDDVGKLLCGPFAVAARAGDARARTAANPTRNPLLRYGDTPTGTYRVTRIVRAEAQQDLGPHGVIVLEATAGDAALAEANGRYRLFIQGGEPGPDGALRSTSGNLRLADADLAALMVALGEEKILRVDVVAHAGVPAIQPVHVDDSVEDDDPPEIPGAPSSLREMFGELSRRDALRAGAGGAAGLTALSLAVSFVSLGTPSRAETYTRMAYDEHAGTPPIVGTDEHLSDAPHDTTPNQTIQLNPGANTPEAQQIQSGQTGGGGTPPTPAPQISGGGAAVRQGNTASTGSSSGAAASSGEGASATAGAPFDSTNPGSGGSGSSAPAVSTSSSTANPTAEAPTAKQVWFQQMNDANKIADPSARNAAINKANADYTKALGAPPAATLPTNPPPPPPPATTTPPAAPTKPTTSVLDKSGN
jgi:hypothetical protein